MLLVASGCNCVLKGWHQLKIPNSPPLNICISLYIRIGRYRFCRAYKSAAFQQMENKHKHSEEQVPTVSRILQSINLCESNSVTDAGIIM